MSGAPKFRRGVARVRAIRELITLALEDIVIPEGYTGDAGAANLHCAINICDELIAESTAPDTVPPPANGASDELEDLRAARAQIRHEVAFLLEKADWMPFAARAFVAAVDHYMAAEERIESRVRETVREATEGLDS